MQMKMLGRLSILCLLTLMLMPSVGWAQAGGTRIGVVDIAKVLDSLKEREEVLAELRTMGRKLEEVEKGLMTQIKQIDADIKDGLAPKAGTPGYTALMEKLEKLNVELQVKKQYHQNLMAREMVIRMQALYEKAIGELGALAKRKGIELVLFKDTLPQGQPGNQQQLVHFIQLRKILYADSKLDMTNELITEMNNQFSFSKNDAAAKPEGGQ